MNYSCLSLYSAFSHETPKTGVTVKGLKYFYIVMMISYIYIYIYIYIHKQRTLGAPSNL